MNVFFPSLLALFPINYQTGMRLLVSVLSENIMEVLGWSAARGGAGEILRRRERARRVT